ncbi:hypothetical protein L1267_15790 [Pseudoalteromonas sp. OFAV1]|jgi:hypothetical protein|uniref:hypothetical protein n=1 Tax=Pseudoalteromonas sp. OFAV1 TaxID=2908892 RepID=UPI001F4347E9|nr:hypothetical protein [Pseudoalteromonas sp. OFAV1]MCF2901838.1 hypothetical protein [Pseudoalteromonas sp. OFAV1]
MSPKALFREEMERLGIKDSPVLDENGDVIKDVTLFTMANESLWLPKFVLKANEVSEFIFKAPCFDVLYKLDKDNASGFSLEEPEPAIKSKYGYTLFPVELESSILKRLVRYSLKESLNSHPEGYQLREQLGMYHHMENDEYLRPLEPDVGLVASMWEDRLSRLAKAHKKTLELTRTELDIQP